MARGRASERAVLNNIKCSSLLSLFRFYRLSPFTLSKYKYRIIFKPLLRRILRATRPPCELNVRRDCRHSQREKPGGRAAVSGIGIIGVSFRTEPYKTCLTKTCLHTRLAFILYRYKTCLLYTLNPSPSQAHARAQRFRLHYPRPGPRALTRRPPSADAHAHRALPCPAP